MRTGPYSVCPLYLLLLAPVFFIICHRILYCLPYRNLNILYHLPYQLFLLAPNYKSISFQHNFHSCIMLTCMKILLYNIHYPLGLLRKEHVQLHYRFFPEDLYCIYSLFMEKKKIPFDLSLNNLHNCYIFKLLNPGSISFWTYVKFQLANIVGLQGQLINKLAHYSIVYGNEIKTEL